MLVANACGGLLDCTNDERPTFVLQFVAGKRVGTVGNVGTLALFGSGETSRHGRKVQDALLGTCPPPVNVAIVETPAGFQPNCDAVHAKIATFFTHNLQNHKPNVIPVRARARGTAFDPDDETIAGSLANADYVFAGPGSPTYAVRQLQGSRTLAAIEARWLGGAPLVLASAAAIAISPWALPVYEIFKVGDDPHWVPGLDLLAHFGLAPVVVPHWNNAEGGAELDTSRCYMGVERFEWLRGLLPPETVYLGVDEHTACLLDLGAESCSVAGFGGVTLVRPDGERRFENGERFAAGLLRA